MESRRIHYTIIHPPLHTLIKECIFCIMNYSQGDPIAALASPPGQSAIAVIRTSGDQSLLILSRLFKSRIKPDKARSHTLHHGVIVSPDTGETIDEVVIGIYRGPSSYTGEESAEIFCHGSLTIVKKLMILLEKNGFRHARAGEFTLRAFLNRKIDLTRAEAVNEIIRARSDRGRALALNRLSGVIEERINDIKQDLLKIQAAVEVRIDYPDEDIEEPPVHYDQLETVKEQIMTLLATYRTGKLIQEGITVVIAGSTNAGKSTLFNLLLREDRAIVSDIHGTTRDYIEGAITVQGIPVRLFDTAGLRRTGHPVEQEGIRRTDMMMENADVLIYIIDGSNGIDNEPDDINSLHQKENTIVVWNKTDISTRDVPAGCIPISAKLGTGLKQLNQEIVNKVLGTTHTESGGPVIDSERQKELLTNSLSALEEFEQGVKQDIPLDVCATCLKDALDNLGMITGEVTTADMLEVMFSQFCVGK